MKTSGGKHLQEGLKSLVKGLFKVLSVLLSFFFKVIGTIGEKLGELFEKLASK